MGRGRIGLAALFSWEPAQVYDARRKQPRPLSESVPRRAWERDHLFLSATIRKEAEKDGPAATVRVRNLSAIGLMADYTDVAAPGDPVVVTVRGIGSVAGMVNWVRCGRIGIIFDVEVDPKMARKPVRKMPPPPPQKQRPL